MFPGLSVEDPNFEQRAYTPWASYGQSKLGNILHVKELARRMKEEVRGEEMNQHCRCTRESARVCLYACREGARAEDEGGGERRKSFYSFGVILSFCCVYIPPREALSLQVERVPLLNNPLSSFLHLLPASTELGPERQGVCGASGRDSDRAHALHARRIRLGVDPPPVVLPRALRPHAPPHEDHPPGRRHHGLRRNGPGAGAGAERELSIQLCGAEDGGQAGGGRGPRARHVQKGRGAHQGRGVQVRGWDIMARRGDVIRCVMTDKAGISGMLAWRRGAAAPAAAELIFKHQRDGLRTPMDQTFIAIITTK
jgi:hypothetical protein